jgi:CheY-like chemotaxis protein
MAKKILIVEDEKELRKFEEKIFKTFGYETLTAKNYSEAINLLEEHPDLIFSDTELGENNLGYEICEKIKANGYSDIKVIGKSGKDYKEEWLKRGADYFFQKPYNLNELEEKLEEILGE